MFQVSQKFWFYFISIIFQASDYSFLFQKLLQSLIISFFVLRWKFCFAFYYIVAWNQLKMLSPNCRDRNEIYFIPLNLLRTVYSIQCAVFAKFFFFLFLRAIKTLEIVNCLVREKVMVEVVKLLLELKEE